MDSINQIEIRISGVGKNQELFIIPSTSKVYIHGEEKEISKDIIGQIIYLIHGWDDEYIDDQAVDCETYNIKVYTGEGVHQYFGSGKYPNNYAEFKSLINGIDSLEEEVEVL